jgi:hypothetical protein
MTSTLLEVRPPVATTNVGDATVLLAPAAAWETRPATVDLSTRIPSRVLHRPAMITGHQTLPSAERIIKGDERSYENGPAEQLDEHVRLLDAE